MPLYRTILYVSRKRALWPDDRADVDAIVAVARERNAANEVTGTLASTDTYFAQALEGPEPAVGEIMGSILRDPRHYDVNVVSDSNIRRRFYPTWNLAYAGPGSFISGLIAPLLEVGPGPLEIRRLTLLLREFNKYAGDA